jgi:anti-sigma factor RsiW
MSNDLLNILSNSNKDIDNQKLMDYISGKLSKQEQHELEKEMADNELMNDAVEGLRSIKDQHAIQNYVEQLNKNLHNQLQHKKAKRQKRKLRDQPFVYIAIVLVLALIVIAYMIIQKLQSQP